MSGNDANLVWGFGGTQQTARLHRDFESFIPRLRLETDYDQRRRQCRRQLIGRPRGRPLDLSATEVGLELPNSYADSDGALIPILTPTFRPSRAGIGSLASVRGAVWHARPARRESRRATFPGCM